MNTMLERRPFGLRLEHIVWRAPFRYKFLDLMPHPWITDVAVTRLIRLDRERLFVTDQPVHAATDGRQATRNKGIQHVTHFLGSLHEQLPKNNLGSARKKSRRPVGSICNRATGALRNLGSLCVNAGHSSIAAETKPAAGIT